MKYNKFESHVASQGEALWSQSYYFNAYDPVSKIGCLVRVGLLENAGQANSWLIVFKEGLPVFTRTNLNLPYTSERPDGGMQIAGMHIEALQPLKELRIRVDERDFAMDLVWTARQELADSIAMSKGDLGSMADDIAQVHLEGPCTVKGHIALRGQRHAVDGKGMRDVSAGVRNWDNLHHYRLSWPLFDNEQVFCGIRGTTMQDQSAYMRMFNDGQRWLRVTAIDDHNSYQENNPFFVQEMRWSFTDETGATHAFTAKPLFGWLFAQDTFVVCEQMMEYRLSDGTLGYGLYEGGFRLPWTGEKI